MDRICAVMKGDYRSAAQWSDSAKQLEAGSAQEKMDSSTTEAEKQPAEKDQQHQNPEGEPRCQAELCQGMKPSG